MADSVQIPDPGSFVTEVGIRQAWLFLAMRDNSLEGSEETRLYLDTNFVLNGDRFDLDSDELESGLLALSRLLNRTLEGSSALADGGLVLDFGGGIELELDGEGAATTTHDVWWLGRVGGGS